MIRSIVIAKRKLNDNILNCIKKNSKIALRTDVCNLSIDAIVIKILSVDSFC